MKVADRSAGQALMKVADRSAGQALMKVADRSAGQALTIVADRRSAGQALMIVADRSAGQTLMIVADRSAGQSPGRLPYISTLPMHHSRGALIGGAISDHSRERLQSYLVSSALYGRVLSDYD